MYYEYWGMNKSPFDNVPDPSMYFNMHQSVENAISEVLFAIKEGDECLAVVIGEVGLGKTTTLRVVLDSLDPSRYRVAFVTNPDVTFPQLLREIIGQLKGEPCEIKRKDLLLEEFNRLIFESIDGGKKVLVFIDEGNAFKSANLESLRLLTNMQEDRRNLFTIILAGQPKLAKMLEDPRRENLFQRIGVYCCLEKMPSAEVVRFYIEHRLEKAGLARSVFTMKAIEKIYEFSNGIPRLVNKICKLCLKAGETNGLKIIDDVLVSEIAGRFKKTFRHTRKKASVKAPAPADVPVQTAEPEPGPLEIAADVPDSAEEPSPSFMEMEEEVPETSDIDEIGEIEAEIKRLMSQLDDQPEEVQELQKEPALVCVSDEAIQEAKHLTDEKDRMRLAGQLAAKEIKQHPEIVEENHDPVEKWKELREKILTHFA